MKLLSLLTTTAAFGLAATLGGCDTAKQQRETGRQVTAEQVNPRMRSNANALEAQEKNGLTVTPYTAQRVLNEAALNVREPNRSANLQPGPVNFACDISNFRLGAAATVPEPGLVMSPLGQAITTLIDNETVAEHGTPTFTTPMTAGEHVVLSFLSRPSRESLKHRLGYDLRTVLVGNAASTTPFDLKAPHLFYNLPRGTYVGDEADLILLDFLVMGATLEEEGTQVRLTVNKTPFTLSRWVAYTLEGLPMGPNTIKLELVDGAGNLIAGPFNSTTRTITLRPGA